MNYRFNVLLLFFTLLMVLTSSCKQDPLFMLSIQKAGNGQGDVLSVPKGIDCNNNCSASFKEKSKVVLTATAKAGSSFSGWSANCIATSAIKTKAAATNSCTVTLDKAKTVTATFTLIPRWPIWLGSKESDSVNALATDSLGNVYVAIETFGSLFGEDNQGNCDVYLAKYNSAGIKQWHKLLGSNAEDVVFALAIDNHDNIYLSGKTQGSLFKETNQGSYDAYVVKYNSEGIKQWHKWLGSSAEDSANEMALDSHDNVHVSIDIDSGYFGETKKDGTYLVKYDSAGNELSHRWLDYYPSALAVDSAGNVFLAGGTWGGSFGETNRGNADAYIVKYDSKGTYMWHNWYGSKYFDFAKDLATDGSNNIFLVFNSYGNFFGEVNQGAYLVKYNSSGNRLWHKRLSTLVLALGTVLATDSAGNIFLAGETDTSVFGETNKGYDAYLVKYNSFGNKQWHKWLSSEGADYATALDTDNAGNVYLAGDTYDSLFGEPNQGSQDAFIVKY